MAKLDGRRVAVVGSVDHPWLRALDAALAAGGAEPVELDGSPIDVVVHLTPMGGEGRSLLDTDEATWDAAAEAPARAFLATLQAAHPGLATTRGRLVVVLPSVVSSGAAGLVAETTGWGTVRLLAASAARRWVGDGVGVTIVTYRPHVAREDLVEAVRSLAADGPALVEVVLR